LKVSAPDCFVTSMKIKTRIKAGLGGNNHSETLVRG
jgi:hypothetical protein